MSGLVVTGWRRMVGQEVRPGSGGGLVGGQCRGHCGAVAGELGGQPVVITQGRVVAGGRGDVDQLFLPVGVRILVLPVVRRGDVDLNVNGVREEA